MRAHAVRCGRSFAKVEDARRARAVGTSRQTAPRVVERTCTNEIIEEETGKIKIEVIAENLQDSVDENGEPRLASSRVWSKISKKLQALSSPVLTNALRKKANTQLSVKNRLVMDTEWRQF